MSFLQRAASSRFAGAATYNTSCRIHASMARGYRTKATVSSKSTEAKPQTSAAEPPGPTPPENAQIREQSPAEGIPNQPDYNVAADYRTSAFSPIPKRVMDGSEPGETVPAAVLSGAPTDLQARTVRIYRPTKTATQSGDWHSHHWLMDWDVMGKGHRWENPLIGWQSSADFMQGHRIQFKSKEDAIMFANKQGYEYFVQEPNNRKFVPKAYANNFLHSPKKLKTIRTK